METKVCCVCFEESNKFIGNKCRSCVSKYSLQYYHSVKHKKGIKSVVHKTKEEKDEYRRSYEKEKLKKDRAKEGKTVRLYRNKADVTKEQLKTEMLEAAKRYRERNKEKRRKSAREWGKRNRSQMSAYLRDRYKNNEQYNISSKLRSRLKIVLRNKGISKTNNCFDLLGCSYDEFKDHIHSTFTDGMTWDLILNGKLHLDHIKPCAKFDLTKEEEQKQCFHYSNFQALWALDNLKKGAKYAKRIIAA